MAEQWEADMLQHHHRALRRIGATLALSLLAAGGAALGPLPQVSFVSAGASHTESALRSGGAVVAQRGDRTPVVRTIQQALVNAGITVRGGVDGIFGPGTQAAVTEYQRKRGLPANGIVDTATAVALGVLPATPLLARGANGAAVTTVQRQLIAVGITPRGGADGWYGSGTEAAVRQFQASRGLPTTGSIDAATGAILAHAAAGASTPPTTAPTTTAPSTTAPPTTTPTSTVLLKPGAVGSAVAAFQRELIAVGHRPAGGADGRYGPATVAALKAFQGKTGLPATGVYDQATATALTAAAKAAAPTTTTGSGSGGSGSGGSGSGGPSGTNADGTVTLAGFPMP
ncbi:MAG TPA: hypothetical protein DCR14_14590, partial [Acidimicrobiaceae bacterium]|nr:hypothetical protein [Acidimicrobiaceae bacterium]